MGGILGLWNRDGRPADPSLLTRLRGTMPHRREVDVLVAGSMGTHVAFDGRLDNREALIERLALRYDVDTRAPDGALVQAAYREWDDGFAAHLNGDFAAAVFDAGRRMLLLARDALGVRPLHYYVSPAAVIFASEIKPILAHPQVRTSPNDDVLADYLLNYFAAEDTQGVTFFTDIWSVLPSHVVRVTADAVRSSRYWDFDPNRRLPVRTIDEAAEGFREHFTRAVQRRLRASGPVAVSVSGGLDSSAIFGVAETLRRTHGGPRVIGCSYTVADGLPADEKAYLAEIERVYGVRIEQWRDLPGGVIDGSREGVRHLEGPLLEARWTGTLAYYNAMRALGATTLLTGHWGDQFLVDDGFVPDLLRSGRWAMLRRWLRNYTRWRDDGAGDPRGLVTVVLRELLPAWGLDLVRRAREFKRVPHDLESWYAIEFRQRAEQARRRRPAEGRSGTAHARAIYRMARSRYYVLGMERQHKLAAMHGMEVAFPFLDRDLIAFLMAIPGHIVTWNGVPKQLMRHALRDVLPEGIAGRTTKADFSLDANTETAQDYDKLVAGLKHGAAARYLTPQAMRDTGRFRPEPGADTATLSWALTDLLGLELWLGEFFGDREWSDHARRHQQA